MNTPTLIGMPEPPSNPDTPTDTPGTPNSTTTSLSTLSTTAIKDGHRGASLPHGHRQMPSNNTLEAERADRISRLAGLERVSTARPSNPNTPGGSPGPAVTNLGQIPGYFDQNGNPVYTTKMSTVGSASATGSVGGGQTTTWASGSTKGVTERDDDEMSTDANYRDIDDRDRYSASAMDEDMDGDGMSDDTSLVGFGEGAGSTVSGPTYSRREAPLSAAGRSLAGQWQSRDAGTPNSASTTQSAEQARRDAKMLDATADDVPGYIHSARPGERSSGVETAERIMRERLDDGDGRKPALGHPDEAGLGKFYFEEKR